jgi:hypothetical protein
VPPSRIVTFPPCMKRGEMIQMGVDMTVDLFNAELEAQRSLLDLYEQAKKCQVLFEHAHIALPEVLKRVLGMNGAGDKAATSRITAPQRPPMPPEAQQNWISIRDKEVTPTTIVLAILRGTKGPMRPRDLNDRVMNILPNVLRGSISNIGSRLDDTLIRRTNEGWELLKPEAAGILHKGYVWGPPVVFGKTELAAQRREALLHLLQFFESGLQIVQIVEQLKQCPWIVAPINKDLVKEDIAGLAKEGKIKRRGNSKKWELSPIQEK